MYILIDKENMLVMRKHAESAVLWELQYIEGTHTATIVLGCTREHLASEFTDYELKKLYKSITGYPLQTVWSDGIIEGAWRACMCLEPDNVNRILVKAQADYLQKIENDDLFCPPYRYADGSVKPTSILPLEKSVRRMDEKSQALGNEPLPATATLRQPAKYATQARAAVPSVATQGQRPANEPRRATGTTATVFEVADKMWDEAGKPKELTAVLALRKKMMAVLESEYGIKRTTSSSTLGNWHKLRI